MPIGIKGFTQAEFVGYTHRQLSHFFPVENSGSDEEILANHFEEALQRLAVCTRKILAWQHDQFDPLLSAQHSTFLYFLGNTIWRRTKEETLPTKLFLLNKALHSIELYFKIELPPVFLLGHTIGIVLSNTEYGNYFAVFQNSTVGRYGDDRPKIGKGVFMFPNTSIIGRCEVRDRTVLSQGTRLLNHDTPGDTTVFESGSRTYTFAKGKSDVYGRFFRNPEL